MQPTRKVISSMSAAFSADYRAIVRWLEDERALHSGSGLAGARASFAREIGLSPSTLENLRKGRLKGLRGEVERRIDAAFVRMLERKKAGIEHELELATARLDRGPESLLAKAAATRDALDALIRKAGAAR